jgi:hypothetical protein
MPFQYVRDDSKGRVTFTLSDPLTVAERIAAIEHQLSDEAWRYGVIIDARSLASYTPQLTEMQATTSRLAELVAGHGPRGPVAIVSRQAGVIGASAMHNSLCANSRVHVFWDMDEARRFLDQLDPVSQVLPRPDGSI